MNKIQALNSFWNSFDIKAYDEHSVPDGAQLPYITYSVSDDDFGNTLILNASLWYRSSGWSEITLKELQISDYIGRGGVMVPYDNGSMWIRKTTPWAQRMNDPSDEKIRRMYLGIQVEFLD